jgi:ABC-type transport system involved in cytochrome c biogenesis permease subunit
MNMKNLKHSILFNLIVFCGLSSVPTSYLRAAETEAPTNLSGAPVADASAKTTGTDTISDDFAKLASNLSTDDVESVAIHNNGRMKPLYSLARETNLFLTGQYSKWGLSPVQFYLGLILFEKSESLKFLNIRDIDLRERLGLLKSEKLFSIEEIEHSPLSAMAEPLVSKQQSNARSLTPSEKSTLEAYQQLWVAKQVLSGSHFLEALDFSFGKAKNQDVIDKGKGLLQALATRADPSTVTQLGRELKLASVLQEMPESFRSQVTHLDAEVFYLKTRLFFIAAICFFALGGFLLFAPVNFNGFNQKIRWLALIPLVLSGAGFATRVWITGFAPVTNMYGTMLWVSFGVGLFSLILFYLYQNRMLTGLLWMGSGLVLLIAESMPLILSPDMDPIVAVLRSNLWLTIHVLTITISYAAFTITMLIGNVSIIRSLWKKEDQKFQREYAHAAYRMVQLGVFLLSVGIVLGGIWADYSWGRFWGWDPKETWALIADLGYIAILHARFIGWLGPYGLLMASPFAYLLVIMAWYGVNFILATGLHSYGFSSGGTKAVVAFVLVQLAVIAVAGGAKLLRKKSSV